MTHHSNHPEPSAALPELDAPESDTEAVRGGFLGGLVRRIAPVARPAASLTPTIPIPPPAD